MFILIGSVPEFFWICDNDLYRLHLILIYLLLLDSWTTLLIYAFAEGKLTRRFKSWSVTEF